MNKAEINYTQEMLVQWLRDTMAEKQCAIGTILTFIKKISVIGKFNAEPVLKALEYLLYSSNDLNDNTNKVMKSAMLYYMGMSINGISKTLHMDKRTVHRNIESFEESGMSADVFRPKLTEEQAIEVSKMFDILEYLGGYCKNVKRPKGNTVERVSKARGISFR